MPQKNPMQEVETPWKIKIGRSPLSSGIDYEGKPVKNLRAINIRCDADEDLTYAEIELIAPSVVIGNLVPTIENREIIISELKTYIEVAQIKREELYGD